MTAVQEVEALAPTRSSGGDAGGHPAQRRRGSSTCCPATGASIAGGRIRTCDGVWRDLLRPTRPSVLGEPEKCASFPMIPWSNRISDGVLPFGGRRWQLQRNGADGTAIHGAARHSAWTVVERSESPRGARARHHRAGRRELPVAVPRADHLRAARRPAHGRHVGAQHRRRAVPGRLRAPPVPAAHAVPGRAPPRRRRPASPCSRCPPQKGYALVNALAVRPGRRRPAARRLPRRRARWPRRSSTTCSPPGSPARPCGSATRTSASASTCTPTPCTRTWSCTPPGGGRYFAVEPVTNVNNGFSLHAAGVPGTGVFVLDPGEERCGAFTMTLRA